MRRTAAACETNLAVIANEAKPSRSRALFGRWTSMDGFGFASKWRRSKLMIENRRRPAAPCDWSEARNVEYTTIVRCGRSCLSRGPSLSQRPARSRGRRSRGPASSLDARLDRHRQWRPQPLRGRHRAREFGQGSPGRRAGRQFQQSVQPAGHRRHDHRLQPLLASRPHCSPSCRRTCRNAPAASASPPR